MKHFLVDPSIQRIVHLKYSFFMAIRHPLLIGVSPRVLTVFRKVWDTGSNLTEMKVVTGSGKPIAIIIVRPGLAMVMYTSCSPQGLALGIVVQLPPDKFAGSITWISSLYPYAARTRPLPGDVSAYVRRTSTAWKQNSFTLKYICVQALMNHLHCYEGSQKLRCLWLAFRASIYRFIESIVSLLSKRNWKEITKFLSRLFFFHY